MILKLKKMMILILRKGYWKCTGPKTRFISAGNEPGDHVYRGIWRLPRGWRMNKKQNMTETKRESQVVILFFLCALRRMLSGLGCQKYLRCYIHRKADILYGKQTGYERS